MELRPEKIRKGLQVDYKTQVEINADSKRESDEVSRKMSQRQNEVDRDKAKETFTKL